MTSKKINPNSMQAITQCMQIIDKNLSKDISTHELSDHCQLTKQECNEAFEKTTHQTPSNYQERLRAEHGLLMLVLGYASLDNVHNKLGYTTSEEFSTAFVKYFAAQPGDLLKHSDNHDHLIGFLPSEYANNAINENDFSCVQEHINITECEPIDVQFIRHTGRYKDSFKPWFAMAHQAASIKEILKDDVKKIGVTHDFPSITPEKFLRYDACITQEKAHPQLNQQTLAGGLYLIYHLTEGVAATDKTLHYLLTQWLPQSEYKLRIDPIYYIYSNMGAVMLKSERIHTHIHIPIIKK